MSVINREPAQKRQTGFPVHSRPAPCDFSRSVRVAPGPGCIAMIVNELPAPARTRACTRGSGKLGNRPAISRGGMRIRGKLIAYVLVSMPRAARRLRRGRGRLHRVGLPGNWRSSLGCTHRMAVMLACAAIPVSLTQDGAWSPAPAGSLRACPASFGPHRESSREDRH